MAKSIDFWSGAGCEFDPKKALASLSERVAEQVKKDPGWAMDAGRLVLSLQTKPRTDAKPESSIFQSFKGFPLADLRAAGVKVDEKTVTFTGFNDDASGMADLDAFLCGCGALRRTVASRTKGWPFVSDPVLASTPKLSPTDRVGGIQGARQISIALPPTIAKSLPSWASASSMVGFFVECGRHGLAVGDLEAFLTQAKRDPVQRWSYPTNNASNNDNNPNNDNDNNPQEDTDPNNNPQEDTDNDNNPNNDNDNDNDAE